MFNTINGFDLLLIITIVVMGFRIYNLNRECESYVGQILRLSWDLQEEIQASKHMHSQDNKYCACESCVPF